MSNLGILLKNDVSRMLGSVQGKKNRKKTGIVVCFCVLAYIGICVVFGLQIEGLFETMKDVKKVPLFSSMQIMLMVLLVVAFQSLTGKSKTTDSDFLLSLPLKKYEIVLSKTISKYSFSLMLASMVMLPTLVLYSAIIEVSASVIVWGIVLLLLLPLLSVGLNYIINFLLVRLFNRMKHANLVKTLFAIVLFGGLIAIYVYNSAVMGTITMETIDDYLNSNFLIGWCVKLMADSNLLCLLYLALVTFGVFAIGVVLYSSIFGKTFVAYKNKSAKVTYSNNGSFGTLFKKELRKYFSTPIYMFNTIIGPIILVLLTVFLLIKGNSLRAMIGMLIDTQTIFAILTLIYLYMCAMTQVSCVSVSLEGRYLWILKSMPVNSRYVLLSKSLLNMLIFLPVHLITATTISIVFGAGTFEFLMFVLLPVLLNILTSFGGTYINLLLPKLNWDNEVQVVKNSLSVIVTMLISIFFAFVPLILNLCGLDIYLTAYLTLGIYFALCVATIILLMTSGVQKFNKLAC
jgi:ABC-2 type transport system permease protein